MDWVLSVFHGAGNTDNLPFVHLVVHDATARLSDLHEIGDGKLDIVKIVPDTQQFPHYVYDRDDLSLHIYAASKDETAQRGEYQFARRHARGPPHPLEISSRR